LLPPPPLLGQVQEVGEVVQLERADEAGSDRVVELELLRELSKTSCGVPLLRGAVATVPAQVSPSSAAAIGVVGSRGRGLPVRLPGGGAAYLAARGSDHIFVCMFARPDWYRSTRCLGVF
jgi:hypothetical protein